MNNLGKLCNIGIWLVCLLNFIDECYIFYSGGREEGVALYDFSSRLFIVVMVFFKGLSTIWISIEACCD